MIFFLSGLKVLDLLRKRFLEMLVLRRRDDALDLSYKGLTAFPGHPEKLTNLTMLNLSHNKLMQMPESIGALVHLLYLFANNNQLSLLPTSMKHLEKLQELDLKNNKLKGLFKDIGDLKQLQKLYLEGNPLKLQVIKSLVELMDRKPGKLSIDIAGEHKETLKYLTL